MSLTEEQHQRLSTAQVQAGLCDVDGCDDLHHLLADLASICQDREMRLEILGSRVTGLALRLQLMRDVMYR